MGGKALLAEVGGVAQGLQQFDQAAVGQQVERVVVVARRRQLAGVDPGIQIEDALAHLAGDRQWFGQVVPDRLVQCGQPPLEPPSGGRWVAFRIAVAGIWKGMLLTEELGVS